MIPLLRAGCLVALIGVAGSWPAAAVAQAKSYPNKPIRLVNPYTPGGTVDLVARTIAQKLTETWGLPVIVDNRPGAGTTIGTEIVAHAVPDGYTLLQTSGTIAANVTLYPKLSFHPVKDLAPIAMIVESPYVFVVHPSLPAKSVRELVAIAKKRPGEMNYASGGVGSAQHIPMELLKAMTGIEIVHVAYKGLTPAFNDVLAGQVPMMVSGLVTSLPYHRSGRLRILGTTGTKRTSATPDVPTVAEAGLPGYEADSWTGVIVPRGTPPDIVAQIYAEVVRVSQMSDTRERLLASGFEVVGSSSEAFAALIRNDTARLGKVIRDAGIRAE